MLEMVFKTGSALRSWGTENYISSAERIYVELWKLDRFDTSKSFVGSHREFFARGARGCKMRVYRMWQRWCWARAVLSGHSGGCSRAHAAKLSSFPVLHARKKNSHYSEVDSEHYSSVVKAVVSTRGSSQTPESIEHEDQCLYGSVVKSSAQMCRALKNPWPLLNLTKPVHTQSETGCITRINLQRSSDHMPSVTKILQKTMSAKQAFLLERWRKRMISELGVEGFKEYSNSKLLFPHCGVYPLFYCKKVLWPRKLSEQRCSFIQECSIFSTWLLIGWNESLHIHMIGHSCFNSTDLLSLV